MQKFIFFLFTFISFSAFSQNRKFDPNSDHENFFRIGAKAGVNINKINGQAYKSGFNYNYLLGGFMQFNFSKTFGLQPEINFVQSSSEFTNDPSSVYDDLFRGGEQRKAKLDYLKVPVLLNINIGPSKRVKLQLGPQYANVLKQTVDSLKSNGDIFKKADWAAVGGMWIQIPFINIGARYEIGLTNLNDIDNQQKWKSQAFTIFAGFTF
ncbi:MAG: PorT family protein [Bacteroidota bacterium]|nr:PorT family protein [Bacteroidota bacterium]MDQ6889063.1 PorT family protein [Bacteroidota bacterium]